MITRILCSSRPSKSGADRAHFVRCLGGGPDGHLTTRPLDDEPAGLDGHRGIGLLVDLLGDHVGGRPERLVELVTVPAAQAAGDVALVALVDELGSLLARGIVDERRQRLVVDLDDVGGILGQVAGLGHDERDWIADEADLALGERRAGRVRHLLADHREPHLLHARVEVRGGEHCVHALEGQCSRGVDAQQTCPREGAPDEARMQHPGSHHVVDEGPVAGEQARILHPMNAASRVSSGGHRCGGARIELHNSPSNPFPARIMSRALASC